MRVIRTAFWPPTNDPPIVAFAAEDSLAVPINEFIDRIQEPGMFATFEVFETEITDEVRQMYEGMTRFKQREQIEHYMAIMYHWTAGEIFSLLVPGAAHSQKDPSPFGVEDATYVLKQLVKHPDYRDFTLIAIAQDGQRVTAKGEKITVQQP